MAGTANSIITPQTPKSAHVATTTANSTYSTTPTNSVLLATAGANGSRLTRLHAIPTVTVTTANQLQVFRSLDAGTTKYFADSRRGGVEGSGGRAPRRHDRLPSLDDKDRAMTNQLTAHFALEEFLATQHREFDNTPPAEVVEILKDTATRMEAVRRILGDRVISISSGYRCRALNRAVGGAATSAHLTGHAVDFNCYGFGDPVAICRRLADSDIAFDQMIEEGTWCHISFDPRLRRQVLMKRADGGYGLGLPDEPPGELADIGRDVLGPRGDQVG